jgi:hypothetical protein
MVHSKDSIQTLSVPFSDTSSQLDEREVGLIKLHQWGKLSYLCE